MRPRLVRVPPQAASGPCADDILGSLALAWAGRGLGPVGAGALALGRGCYTVTTCVQGGGPLAGRVPTVGSRVTPETPAKVPVLSGEARQWAIPSK